MAITRIADVFPAHKRRVITIGLIIQTGIIFLLIPLLFYAKIDLLTMVLFILVPILTLQTVALILILRQALEPFDILARTIAQVSNQPHDTTPSNLNGTYHERTGLKMMVDTIYSLALRGIGADTPKTPTNSVLYSALLDRLPGGIIALDEKRNVIYANQVAPVSIDSSGKSHIQLLFDGSDTLEKWLNDNETSQVSAAATWNRVQSALPGDPNRRVFDIAATYQKNGAEGIDTLLLLVDQTTRYSVNEEDMDFIALAAHELRGPITVIRGYLDVLRPELDSAMNDDQRQMFDRLDVSANRLSSYVGNILNASKFDRRHLKLHLREDNLNDIYTLIADDLALRASTQGRVLNVSLSGDLPTIAADRNSLSEVMANLVDNAIKYSREGGQVLVSSGVDGQHIFFRVQDYGIGIPSSVVGSLFSKFYRSHRSRQTVSGTGLGLYISKAIVESHGGRIGLSSTEGEGSIFYFSLPLYSAVAEKLLASGSINDGIIETSNGWIKNHAMYRG